MKISLAALLIRTLELNLIIAEIGLMCPLQTLIIQPVLMLQDAKKPHLKPRQIMLSMNTDTLTSDLLGLSNLYLFIIYFLVSYHMHTPPSIDALQSTEPCQRPGLQSEMTGCLCPFNLRLWILGLKTVIVFYINQMDIPEGANEGCPGPKSEMAGKNQACQGCPNQAACQEKKIDPDILIVRQKMAKVAHKVLILSGKGGVGKSTVSTQLALTLAQSGKRVGLMDIDLCGPSVPRMLGLQGHEIHSSSEGWQPVYATDNLAVISIGFLLNSKNQAVIWRGPRKNGLIKQFLTDVVWGQLDYLLIDTPPGTSDQHLSIVQYLQLTDKDGAIIVTTPQQVALSDVRKEISFCKKTNTNIIGMIQNMSGFVCPNCKCQSQIFPPNTGGAQALCNEFKLDLLGKMPIQPSVSSMTETGGWLGDHPGQSGLQLIRMGKLLQKKLQ